MTPRTNTEKRVFKLSQSLPPITDAQQNWGYKNALGYHAIKHRCYWVCSECGMPKVYLKEEKNKRKKFTCSHCGKTLHKLYNYKPKEKIKKYLSIITVKEEFQVIRTFLLWKYIQNQKAYYFSSEVQQHWIDGDGNVTYLSKLTLSNPFYVDIWAVSSNMEIRYHEKSLRSKFRFEIYPDKAYPVRRFIPNLKRNGFDGRFYDINPLKLFMLSLKEPKFETLLKAKQFDLFRYFSENYSIDRYWNSIKICIRNKYIVNDASIWIDYLDLLIKFGKDIRSPKYVCPTNLIKEHDRYVRKDKERIRRIKIEELKDQIHNSNAKYASAKSKFFDLMFSDVNITVKALRSVEEFLEDGIMLNHCVFNNEYYKKEHSLCLTARINGSPVETVEVSLSSFKILQSRGLNNKPSKYHRNILKLVNSNMSKIRQLAV